MLGRVKLSRGRPFGLLNGGPERTDERTDGARGRGGLDCTGALIIGRGGRDGRDGREGREGLGIRSRKLLKLFWLRPFSPAKYFACSLIMASWAAFSRTRSSKV